MYVCVKIYSHFLDENRRFRFSPTHSSVKSKRENTAVTGRSTVRSCQGKLVEFDIQRKTTLAYADKSRCFLINYTKFPPDFQYLAWINRNKKFCRFAQGTVLECLIPNGLYGSDGRSPFPCRFLQSLDVPIARIGTLPPKGAAQGRPPPVRKLHRNRVYHDGLLVESMDRHPFSHSDMSLL